MQLLDQLNRWETAKGPLMKQEYDRPVVGSCLRFPELSQDQRGAKKTILKIVSLKLNHLNMHISHHTGPFHDHNICNKLKKN